MPEINLTIEDATGMQQIEFRSGSRLVISTCRPNGGWRSRLYTNGGETATLTCAKHRSGRGVRAWAERTLRGPA